MAALRQMTRDSPRLDAAAYLVLGMIRLGARSGYEIKQTVEKSLRFFWTISPAQIYPSLERLERAALIKGKSEPLGKRRRRTFTITSAGNKALRDWLRQHEPIPFELRDIGLLKLFFADALDQDGALALLDAVKGRSEERVATLRSIEPVAASTEQDGNVYPMLTLRMGIAFHQAMLDACGEFEQKIFGIRRRAGRKRITGGRHRSAKHQRRRA
jgi:PadR family transcriptional regulator, regulatory protein AphA